MTVLTSLAFILLCAALMLVSYVERIYTEMGKFLSRDFQENIEEYENKVEPKIGLSRSRTQLSVALLTQLVTAGIALLSGYMVFRDGIWDAAEIAQALVIIILAVIVFNRVFPYVLFTRSQGTWLISLVPILRLLIYVVFPVSIVVGFCLSVAALAEEHEPEQPERQSEAVEALIEAGQEEGILEEGDRELIQSVVEFGDTTVREVMTPRPEVVAVPAGTSVEQFTELLRTKPFSRVPVYKDSIDHVTGIVMGHDVLQIPDTEAKARTVEQMMRPVHFVPESKKVSELLREMQKENVHLAMVIDEYGLVAGLVTIEDLVEEIVGEIRDEHEGKADVVHEGDKTYILPGSIGVDKLEELFGVRPEPKEATTLAGFVSEVLGRIPKQGEVIEEEGLRFEILQSTDRRVERLRVSPVQAKTPKQMRA